MNWHSYPSVFALGHRAIAEILLDPVLVEEKIDGSQISFGRFQDAEFGELLRIRSKGADLNILAPEKLFIRAVEVIKERLKALQPGWIYRGEYLAKPKHNVLAYDRTPNNHIILFDVNTGHEEYLDYESKVGVAWSLGFETVPMLFEGIISDVSSFRDLLDTPSCLGGQKVEGLVVKNYARFGIDKHVLMGKFVSEVFKETHKGEWRRENPTSGDILDRLTTEYKSPARWAKAVQHLREADKLEGSPRDIGLLIKEVPLDIEKECEGDIRDALYAWAWPKLRRSLCSGVAEWYKERLLEQQFANQPVADKVTDA